MKNVTSTLFRLTILVLIASFTLSIKVAFAESTYDRILKSGVIRCGYIIWPPFFNKDIQSGKFSGMNYDYTEALGDSLGLKIEWTTEVSPGNQVEALRSHKIDAICAGDGPIIPSTLKYLSYSTPLVHLPFFIYRRPDDRRTEVQNFLNLNSKKIRISVIDGDVSGQVARIHFPNAQQVSIPQMASPSQMMLDVMGKKADIVINDPLSMSDFFKSYPKSLVKISSPQPIAIVPNTLSILRSPENTEFLELLNQAIQNIKTSGREKIILTPYQNLSGSPTFFITKSMYDEQ